MGVYYSTFLPPAPVLLPGLGDAWVTRDPSRRSVISADVLLASPSVKMDFHDSPDHHHADVVRKYPKNYKGGPPGSPGSKGPGEPRRSLTAMTATTSATANNTTVRELRIENFNAKDGKPQRRKG